MDIKRDPAGSGLWLVRLPGNRVLQFKNAGEARRTMSKLLMAKAIVECVQSLATATDTAADLWQEYWDRGAPTAEQLTAAGLSEADLTACVTLLENFAKFMNGQTPAADTYRITLNKVRRVRG